MTIRPITRNQGYQVGAASPMLWTGLVNGDSGAPIEVSNLPDKCVHVYGTFGSGGSVTLYGSNNPADLVLEPGAGGATWVALTDPQGNAITKTALSIEQILENPLFMACKVTAGDGTTSLSVAVSGRN